jgi:hypothetical protein
MNVVGSGPKDGENLLRHEPQLRPGTDDVRVRVRVRVRELGLWGLWLGLGLGG